VCAVPLTLSVNIVGMEIHLYRATTPSCRTQVAQSFAP
jgi:hypothetical protein